MTDVGTKALIAKCQKNAFQAAPAEHKRDIIWAAVQEGVYPSLPRLRFSMLEALAKGADLRLLRAPFVTTADVRQSRTRMFHPFGVAAKVRLVPDGQHPFSGLFESGGFGLVRLSLAMNEREFVPGAALKIFVDGRPSENLLLVPGLDPMIAPDYFSGALTNVLANPTHPPFSVGWPVTHWWMSFAANPQYLPLDPFAHVTADGKLVRNVRAPYQIILRAPEDGVVGRGYSTDFRELLMEIPPGTVLYRVMAKSRAGDPTETYVGHLETESPFLASEFVDRVLSFHHTRDPRGPYDRRYRAFLAFAAGAASLATFAGARALLQSCRRRTRSRP